MSKPGCSRKNFLKLAGITLGGGILAACTRASRELVERVSSPTAFDVPTETTPPQPTSSPPLWLSQTPPALVETVKPAASQTPTFSPTAKPAMALEEEGLTARQRGKLAEVSLKYVAPTETEAIQVARSLGYIENDGHPASVCGPLAVAILRDAGLISKYVDLHDFWLLNPRDGRNLKILERTFPKEDFLWFSSKVSTAEFDFLQSPLKAGDFLYLYAGDAGSFEHMLTVSEVDEAGRAYAVTNFDTPDGYVIQRVMLYDPTRPGAGKLYDWTTRKNYRYGLTGFGGFDLWRLTTAVIEPTPYEAALAEGIDQIIDKHGGKWYLLIKELGRKDLYARKIREPVHPASVIKVPIAMLFYNWLEAVYPEKIEEALELGCDGRSYRQLLKAMLVDSEEKATESILNRLKEARFAPEKVFRAWGTDTIDVVQRIASAHDMGVLFEGLYGNYLPQDAQKLILDALQVYTPGDDTRWGALRKNLPEGYHFYDKRGTITAEFLVMADWAIVECPSAAGKRVFILGAFAYQGEKKTTYEDLVMGLEEIALLFWDYHQQL